MIPAAFTPLANHIWQSTVFAGAAALLAVAFTRNRPQVRYRLWLAASLKFLIPFSLLVSAGAQLEWRKPSVTPPTIPIALTQLTQPFARVDPNRYPATPASSPVPSKAPILIVGLWLLGSAAVLSRWSIRWARIRFALRTATSVPLDAPIPVMASNSLLEPGVFGVFRPVLLLPDGIADRLTPAQLQAVLAHELCHVRRRDNLAAAAHMLVEAIFWFHPLVWWIGVRMIEERERACDEEVLRLGNHPQTYAEGILSVCRFYLESPLACASGVTGSDLKKRIEEIMTARITRNLTPARKLLLAGAGLAAIAGPVFIGVLSAPQSHAQSKPETMNFEVASIKPSSPDQHGVRLNLLPGGGFRGENVRVRLLIEFAYEMQPFQVSGGPGWISSEGFDILAKPPQPGEEGDLTKLTDEQRTRLANEVKARMRGLLAERFQLTVQRSSKEMPVYALVIAKSGLKAKQSDQTGSARQEVRFQPGQFSAAGVPMKLLATQLSRAAGRPIIDKTGLTGNFDFDLQWTPDNGPGGGGPGGPGGREAIAGPPPDPSGPSIFTALQEQLGLKLEPQKGQVDTIVIERVEKPSAN